MKIAVSTTGKSLDSEVDPRFGRCQHFIIVDPETIAFEAIDNSHNSAAGGAGIATAQMILSKKVEAVITGNCGPNAHQVLSAANVKVITGVTGSVRDAIEGYRSGKFQANSQPSVSAHFGMGRRRGQ